MPGNKVQLISKYIKIKQNCKLKPKFFGVFSVLDPIEIQALKYELPKKCKIHDIFYVLLLKQDIIKRRQIIDNVAKLDYSNSKEYEIEAICDSKIYARGSKSQLLPSFYNHVLCKDYSWLI